jgi:hypothetical protein
MANPYFRQLPNFEYVSRDKNSKSISDYVAVKNLFKRGKLREDIFQNLSYFEKYSIVGDDRPDNVAYKVYGDATLDWVILLSNNILNIQNEWPLPQNIFDSLMLEKYDTYENLYSGIHHYETEEVRNSRGEIVLNSGIKINTNWRESGNFISTRREKNIVSIIYRSDSNLIEISFLTPIDGIRVQSEFTVSGVDNSIFNGNFVVNSINEDYSSGKVSTIKYEVNYSSSEDIIIELTGNEYVEFFPSGEDISTNQYYYEYLDNSLGLVERISSNTFLTPITNYQYESELENEKRNIYILKRQYLNIVFNDMDEIMTYKKGSEQYVSETLKRADNIRLYQ